MDSAWVCVTWLGVSAARANAARDRAGQSRLDRLTCHRSRGHTTVLARAFCRNTWKDRGARGRTHGAHRSAGTRGRNGRTLVRARAVSPEGCTPAATVFKQFHRSRNLFPASHYGSPKSTSQVLRVTSCHQPCPTLAAARQTPRSPRPPCTGLQLVHRRL